MPKAGHTQAVTWAGAFVLGISIGRWIRQWLEKRGDTLRGAVAQSSQLIAAWRAVEGLEPEESRLFDDPLAASLSGDTQFAQALAAAKCVPRESRATRFYRISVVAARTWWFDAQLEAALARPRPNSGWLAAQLASPRGASPVMGPRQVVVLGAGMDSRPWRLKLPAGLAWFEVDQAPVLAAKQRALQQAGAQISADDAPAAGAHPLRAASWTAVAADLGGDGWVAALAAAGLDPSRPVVWCAEGLLMYITEDRVRSLLAAAAGSCAPGSAFVAHSLTDGFVARLRAGERPGAGATPYPCTLQDAWISGLPDDPSAALREAGWGLELVTTRAAIGREICGGADAAQALCDFDTAPGCTADGEIRFWVAKK